MTCRVNKSAQGSCEASAADFVIWANRWNTPMGELMVDNGCYAVHGLGVELEEDPHQDFLY